MKKATILLAITVLAVIVINSCNDNEQAVLTNPSVVNSNPAMSDPDKFAWDLFIQLNQPSSENPKLTIWETWALASYVYANPNVAPTWKPTIKKDIDNFETLPLQQIVHLGLDQKLSFDPNRPTRNETRMNKVAFDFIVSNDLFNAEGLESMYAAYPRKIDLPIEAKEIKAIWDTIQPKDTSRYYFAIGNGGTIYGLKGLHIITKDIPNWFWSTFEHIDNFDDSQEFKDNKKLLASKDSYGYDANDKISDNLKNDFKRNKMPNKWSYYRLRGTQTDFTDPMGKPIVLANTKIEAGFMMTSSCITCHARATVGAFTPDLDTTGIHQYNRLEFFPAVIGAVNPGLFYKEYERISADTLIKTSKPKYIQLDFMWSFMRAKRKR